MGMSGADREVPEDEPDILGIFGHQALQHRAGHGAVRAFEIAVFEQGDGSILVSQDPIVFFNLRLLDSIIKHVEPPPNSPAGCLRASGRSC